MPTFPSVEWFEAIRNIVNSDEVYRRIGVCYAQVGVKIPDLQEYYLLTFQAFEVVDVREVSESEAENADFWLEAPYERWKEMIRNVEDNGRADLHHTLITIDLEEPEGLARSHDRNRRDLFFRFNRSLQYFFDTSARVETVFR